MIIDADGNRIHFSDADLRSHSEGKVGKEVTFTSRTGLEFWFSSDHESALTNCDDVYLYVHRRAIPSDMEKAIILHINGRSIAFADDNNRFFDYRRSTAVEADDGKLYWSIGSIGAELKAPDKNSPSYHHRLTNAEKFLDRRQQDFAITFVEDVLSNISESILRLAVVRPQHASVIWSDRVKEQLENGSLIEG